MNRPRCYNRQPFTDPNAGWADTGKVQVIERICTQTGLRTWESMKPVYRWRWAWFEDRCASWDSGPSPISESVPARSGWRCEGCTMLPAEADEYLRRRQASIFAPIRWVTRDELRSTYPQGDQPPERG